MVPFLIAFVPKCCMYFSSLLLLLFSSLSFSSLLFYSLYISSILFFSIIFCSLFLSSPFLSTPLFSSLVFCSLLSSHLLLASAHAKCQLIPSTWFGHCNSLWQEVQSMKLAGSSRSSKYSPQHINRNLNFKTGTEELKQG